MILKEKTEQVYRILDSYCPAQINFLPHFDEPWKFLFCVIMSAQTTDRQVSAVSVSLYSRFPDLKSFASADINQIENIIKSTGFYHSKALHLKAAAVALLDNYGGVLPETIEELVKLPGVGRKTANCVIGEVFGRPAVIVDTHFGRLMNRLGLCKSSEPEKIEEKIKNNLNPSFQYRFSMCANLYSRTICHSRNPECGSCVIKEYCVRK